MDKTEMWKVLVSSLSPSSLNVIKRWYIIHALTYFIPQRSQTSLKQHLYFHINYFSEIPKTETNFEERLILKAFLLKFMNAYAPIFYVAFFKGR